jgi:excisionase family DNA binding protein
VDTIQASKELLSPEELAEVLGCGRTYAYQLLRVQAIPSFKLGKLRKVRRRDVERFIEEQAAASAKEIVAS